MHWQVAPKSGGEEKVRELLGGEFVSFSSSIEEANRKVFEHHYRECIRQTGRTQVLTLNGEFHHPDVVVKQVEVNEAGQLTGKALKEMVRARTSLLSIEWADRKTGVIQPIHDLVKVCKEHDIKVHLDVSAAIGKLYCDLAFLEVDYLTFDGALFHAPLPFAGIVSKEGIAGEVVPYGVGACVASALERMLERVDHFAMEIAPLRDQLEGALERLGGEVLYREVERLPNTVMASFDRIHGEKFVAEWKIHGVFASSFEGKVAIALSDESTREEVERASVLAKEMLPELMKSPKLFTEEEAKAKGMRLAASEVKEGECVLSLSLLIDEEDGVIADAVYRAFAPPAMEEALRALCDLVVRKNYMQARRLSADLIEKKMTRPIEAKTLNLVLEAVDEATEECMDIPIEDVYVAPPEMEGGERTVYPGWEELSDEKKKRVISEVVERDVRPYVELDAGGVEVVKVEANRITIAYSGNCTSCFSATGATLDAIGNILRHKIYPDLMVVPDMSLLS